MPEPEGSGKGEKCSLVDEEDAMEDAVAEVASPEGSGKGGKCSLVDEEDAMEDAVAEVASP